MVGCLEDGNRLSKPEICPIEMYEEVMTKCWILDPEKRINFQQIEEKIKTIIHQYKASLTAPLQPLDHGHSSEIDSAAHDKSALGLPCKGEKSKGTGTPAAANNAPVPGPHFQKSSPEVEAGHPGQAQVEYLDKCIASYSSEIDSAAHDKSALGLPCKGEKSKGTGTPAAANNGPVPGPHFQKSSPEVEAGHPGQAQVEYLDKCIASYSSEIDSAAHDKSALGLLLTSI
jgi:hypothetical protein